MIAPAPTQAAVGRAELFRALGVLAEPPGPAQARLADLLDLPRPGRPDWTEAFVVQLVPNAAIYLGPDGMLGGVAADRVAGFWRAMRLPVPTEPDHLVALLGLYAALVDAEQDEPSRPRRTLRRHARAALLHEHLTSWLPAYTHAMTDGGPEPYAAWAALLREALLAEAADLGPPEPTPAHLRSVPPADTGGGLDDLLAGLLVPARSGIVLTRAHLAAAARHNGLGVRLGNRTTILRTLIGQDPVAVLGALSEQARHWQARHRADQPAIGPAAGHWANRAAATAELLAAAARPREAQPREGGAP